MNLLGVLEGTDQTCARSVPSDSPALRLRRGHLRGAVGALAALPGAGGGDVRLLGRGPGRGDDGLELGAALGRQGVAEGRGRGRGRARGAAVVAAGGRGVVAGLHDHGGHLGLEVQEVRVRRVPAPAAIDRLLRAVDHPLPDCLQEAEEVEVVGHVGVATVGVEPEHLDGLLPHQVAELAREDETVQTAGVRGLGGGAVGGGGTGLVAVLLAHGVPPERLWKVAVRRTKPRSVPKFPTMGILSAE